MTEKITLSHGSGGRAMHRLIGELFLKELGNPIARKKNDAGIFSLGKERYAFTTDSYVVNPIFFPGGDIGSLAIHGTVNDLAVCGAKPLYISLGLIIEEGFSRASLEKIVRSIKRAAQKSGVQMIAGDTKVVGKGACDKIFINTSGIGRVYFKTLSLNAIRPGDAVIVSGPVGDHAVSVLSKREGLSFTTAVRSDSQPLDRLIARVLKVSKRVRFMRDPTRGGLGATLNELVEARRFGIEIDESSVPLRAGVRDACELLGLEPFYLACEGRVIVIVDQRDATRVLAAMRWMREGRGAAIVGSVMTREKGLVVVKTVSGSRRILDMPSGEQLPRIC